MPTRLFSVLITVIVLSLIGCSGLTRSKRDTPTDPDHNDSRWDYRAPAESSDRSNIDPTRPTAGGFTLCFNDGADTWRHMDNSTEKTVHAAGTGEPPPNSVVKWAQGKLAEETIKALKISGWQGAVAGWALKRLLGELGKGAPDYSELGPLPQLRTGENVFGIVFSLDVPRERECAKAARDGEWGDLELSILVRTKGGYVFRKLTDDSHAVAGWSEMRFPWWTDEPVQVEVYDTDFSMDDAIATFSIPNPYGYYELSVGRSDGTQESIGKIGFLSESDVLLFRKEALGSRIGAGLSTRLEVVSLIDGTQAGQAGLQPGDTILTYNGAVVESLEDLAQLKEQAAWQQSVRMTIRRDGRDYYCLLKPGFIGINCRLRFQ